MIVYVRLWGSAVVVKKGGGGGGGGFLDFYNYVKKSRLKHKN
jgi:hypothetical protein